MAEQFINPIDKLKEKNNEINKLKKIIEERPEYKEFLRVSSAIVTKNAKRSISFQPVNSVAGGIIRPIAIATGDPHTYRTTKIVKVAKTVNIYTTISYLGGVSKLQVYYKAVILTNVIHALESQGIKVNVNAFSTAIEDDEIIEIVLDIKRTNSGVNYQALYRALCNVEFLRRILFRVRETADVHRHWGYGYGSTCGESFNREYYNLSKSDIYFGTPDELGIYGDDFSRDFKNAINNLNLQDKVDVDRAIERITKSFK